MAVRKAVRKGAQAMGQARFVPDLKPGKYSDGLPLNEVKYLECKIILRPNHFTSRENLFDFGKLMRRPAKEKTQCRTGPRLAGGLCGY